MRHSCFRKAAALYRRKSTTDANIGEFVKQQKPSA